MKKSDVKKLGKLVKTAWWMLLLRGIAFLILGLLFLWRPLETTSLLIWIWGLYLLVDGVFSTVFAIKHHAKLKKWGLLLLQGLLGIIVGLVALFKPVFFTAIAELTILLLIGVALIVLGVLQILATIEFKSGSMFIGAVVLILLGILYFAQPVFSAMIFIYLVGGLMVIGGLACLWYAFQLERIARRIK
ncbi:DUF308 domain-containing protein [Candidatus Woesearchaeota archaeon]|nr:DUF308 domain-containing protein [Candidatus Woesearchaeota archaeon]